MKRPTIHLLMHDFTNETADQLYESCATDDDKMKLLSNLIGIADVIIRHHACYENETYINLHKIISDAITRYKGNTGYLTYTRSLQDLLKDTIDIMEYKSR